MAASKLFLISQFYSSLTVEGVVLPSGTRRVILADGGIYDNIGIETAWKRFFCIFISKAFLLTTDTIVSDAGAKLAVQEPWLNAVSQLVREGMIINEQVVLLRQRQVEASLMLKQREGAYLGIRDATPDVNFNLVKQLAMIPTRFTALSADQINQLDNWGYHNTDYTISKVAPDLLTLRTE